MRRMSALVLAALMVIGITASSWASEDGSGVYLRGGFAYTMLKDPKIVDDFVPVTLSMDDGWGYRLAVGYDFGSSFRVEGEYAYQKNDVDNVGASIVSFDVNRSDMAYTTLMVNGFYDYMLTDQWGLYGMAGLGWGNVEASIYDGDDDDNGWAWKLGFGGIYQINEDWALDLGYEYLNLDDADFDGDLDDIASHNIVGSVRYLF